MYLPPTPLHKFHQSINHKVQFIPRSIAKLTLLCSDHYICLVIIPKWSKIIVLDSSKFDSEHYVEFTNCIQPYIMQNPIQLLTLNHF